MSDAIAAAISAEQAKARSLRRYEASAVTWASDRAEPRLDFYSPFGPMIAKTTMAPTLIARLNRYADRMVTPSAAREFTVPQEVVEDGGGSRCCKSRRRRLPGM